MKKVYQWFCAVMLCVGLCGCTMSHEPVTITNTVSLTGVSTTLQGYRWVEEPYAAVYQIPLTEVITLFEEKGSGILYFGYEGCPWCERAVIELNHVAYEAGVTIYYIDCGTTPDRDTLNEVMVFLDSVLDTDEETGEKSFMVPLVVGVKNGVITKGHTSLVDSFKINNDDDLMSASEKTELQNMYWDIINATKDES